MKNLFTKRRVPKCGKENPESYCGKRLGAVEQRIVTHYDAALEGWSRALDLCDKGTEGHSLRVKEITVRVARHLGFSDFDWCALRAAPFCMTSARWEFLTASAQARSAEF